MHLFGSKPRKILHDLHPGYLSTQFAEQLCASLRIPAFGIQHHEAHFAAILGEHKLFDKVQPVLGVIWDGVGYGTDSQIWGGEFFSYDTGKISRIDHIPYFDFILGDKMPREPRISALTISKNVPELMEMIRVKFTKTEWSVYQKMLEAGDGLKSSSMGRFFDAAASVILGIDRQSYEGEAAMLLEAAAADAYLIDKKPMENYIAGYTVSHDHLLSHILDKVWQDVVESKTPGEIALNVHYSLAMLIAKTAKDFGFGQLAFSGGVFQNALLVDLIIEELGKDYALYFHEKLSPNDECISFGQMMHHLHIKPTY